MPPIKTHKKVKACRICLCAKGENTITFDVDSEWSRVIEYCIGVSVAEEIGPRVLCGKCSSKLVDYAEFKTLALKSDTLWNNVLNVEIKDDPVEYKFPVEIKDENKDYSDTLPDMDYLDEDYVPDSEEMRKAETEYYIDIDTAVKNELEFEECKSKPKKHKKQGKDKEKNTKDNFKGLSQDVFIKKFFSEKKGKLRMKYECHNCAEQLTRRTSLPLHVQKCYESEVLILKPPKQKLTIPSVFECGLCNFQNSNEGVVMKHVNEQHCLPNDLSCKLCEYAGRDVADVIAHRYKHMPQGNKYRGKYRCPTCSIVRLNELSLQFHYRSLHLKKLGGWCSVCLKTFSAYIYFRNHMRLHSEAKYICDHCGAKFLFRNLIISHLKEHMNIRNFICDTCGKSFKRNNALSGHIRAYHTEYKPVSCDHCNKQFKNTYSLKLHMKMVKKGNNFICDVCCKGYANMSLLKKHMFWHTGERPFACETCGGKYKSKGNLKLHMRKHMGIYPYKCASCEKQFMTSTQLKAHSSVHTGIRRVKCLVCDKTFHEKRQMLAHCQSKHESFMMKYETQVTSSLDVQVTHAPPDTIPA